MFCLFQSDTDMEALNLEADLDIDLDQLDFDFDVSLNYDLYIILAKIINFVFCLCLFYSFFSIISFLIASSFILRG